MTKTISNRNGDGMLTTEAPAVFVLISQSMPLLFMENIFALALALFLAGPLIANIQLLLDNTLKSITVGVPIHHKYHGDQRQKHANRTVVLRYPTLVQSDSSSDSDINIEATSIPPTYSTPNMKWSIENLDQGITGENQHNELEQKYKQILHKMFLNEQKTSLLVERSSSFLATDLELPIVDISRFDYDSYRYKLIKSLLKSQYGKCQAPGSVVLNSIHLSSIGSQTGIQLSERYSHSLFDFIEEYYDAAKAMSRKETEYLHPLDHFLVKGTENLEKQHAGTETNRSMTEMDEVPEMISFRDVSPFRNRTALQATPLTSELSVRSRRTISIPKTSPVTSPTTPPSGATSRKSLVVPGSEQLLNRSQNVNPTGNSTKTPERLNTPPQSPMTMRSQKARGVVFTPTSRSNDPSRTPTDPKLLYKRTPGVVQEKYSNGSFTSGRTRLTQHYGGLSTEGRGKGSVSCASASSSGAGSSSISLKSPGKRFVRNNKASSLSSTSRTTKDIIATEQYCTSENAPIKGNATPKELAKVVPRQQLGPRPKSTGGRLAPDVIDVKRPRTANATSNERKTSEAAKSKSLRSDSEFVDSQPDLLRNDLNQPIINHGQYYQHNANQKLPLGFGPSKRAARVNDRDVHSESFVMSPSRLMAKTRDSSSYAKSSINDNAIKTTVGVVKSSLTIQALANRPGSVSRLPIYIGADKITTKKSMEKTNHDGVGERSKVLLKTSPDNADRNVTSSTDEARDPKLAESLGSRSSLLTKMQKDGRAVTAGVSTKEPKDQKRSEKIPNVSQNLISKKITPVCVSSVNQITGSPSLQESKDNSEKLEGDFPGSRRSFLRAHTGRYAASKLMKRETQSSTKKAGKDFEEKNKK